MTGMRDVRAIALDAAANLESGGSGIHAKVAGRHRHVEDAEIRRMLEAGRDRGRSVVRRDGAIAECVQLVEQQLDVGRNVIGNEDDWRRTRSRLAHDVTAERAGRSSK